MGLAAAATAPAADVGPVGAAPSSIGQASTALPMDGGYPRARPRPLSLATLGVGADSVREEEDGSGAAAASDAALLLELQPADGGTAGAALQLRFDEAAERRRGARTISRGIVEGARPWWRTGEP